MNQQQKVAVIESLKQGFKNSAASFLVGYRGLGAGETVELRKALQMQGGRMQVAKIRLIKLAIENVDGACSLDEFLSDQVALIFAQDDGVSIAQTLKKFGKEHESFSLLAGCFDSKLISKFDIERIASLPSREILLAQVCGTMNAPISGFVRVLHQLVVRLLWVLKRIEESKIASS